MGDGAACHEVLQSGVGRRVKLRGQEDSVFSLDGEK